MCHAVGVSVEAELGAVGVMKGVRFTGMRMKPSPIRSWRASLSI